MYYAWILTPLPFRRKKVGLNIALNLLTLIILGKRFSEDVKITDVLIKFSEKIKPATVSKNYSECEKMLDEEIFPRYKELLSCFNKGQKFSQEFSKLRYYMRTVK